MMTDNVPDNRSTNQWGLWPASKESFATNWRELIHYWFVQYNPLYFFSAFCMLAGVYLLTRGLDGNEIAGTHDAWTLGQVFLFAIIQLYEFLLIAAAAFLVHKAGLIRPAIILMMLEGVFLFDCTFRLETISDLGFIGSALSVVWAILVPVKAWLFGKALRIDVPQTILWLLAGGAAGLALMLQTLGIPDVNRAMVILIATWWGAALIALAVIARPRFCQSGAPDIASDDVSKRIVESLLMLLGGMYFYHVLNYVTWVGVDEPRILGPMIGTAFLMVALLRHSEREIWVGAAFSLITSLMYPPATFATCVLATVVLLYRAWQSKNTRFVVGAVLAGYAATWFFAWTGVQPPSPPMWSSVIAVGLLAYLAWMLREPTAVLALAVGAVGMAARYDFNPMLVLPQTRLGLGILLLAAGFLALTVGVWVNWWFRSPTRAIDDGEDGLNTPVESSEPGA
jgi:hypothetical protein